MKNLLFHAILFFACKILQSQPLTSKQIDTLVERTMKGYNVPGIAVAIIKDGKIIHSKGYGIRSIQTMEKVDENTLFGIASNSKAFTATAMGILVDEGKIKWDDKVRDYIPELKLYNSYVTDELTIRDLLTHRSGLGFFAGDLMLFPDSTNFTVKDYIYNLRFLKPVSAFRSEFHYVNSLYIVAGEVIARVSRMSYEDFIEERIVKPLGMSRTAASYVRIKNKSNVIDGHALIDGKLKVVPKSDFRLGHPAGGIYSNISDLSKWVQFHLANGKYGDSLSKGLLSEEVHQEIWTPQTIVPGRGLEVYNAHFCAYGLGFFIEDAKGYELISHTGGLPGMVSMIAIIPELNFSTIVLTNQQEDYAFMAIVLQIIDSYLNNTGIDRVTESLHYKNQNFTRSNATRDSLWSDIYMVQKENKSERDYSIYTGIFNDLWFGEVVISIKNGKLWFDSKRSPTLNGELLPYRGNGFIVKWPDRSMNADAFVNFSLDIQGKASAIKMKAISPLTDPSYDFEDLDLQRIK